jgi:hypothetical protein
MTVSYVNVNLESGRPGVGQIDRLSLTGPRSRVELE